RAVAAGVVVHAGAARFRAGETGLVHAGARAAIAVARVAVVAFFRRPDDAISALRSTGHWGCAFAAGDESAPIAIGALHVAEVRAFAGADAIRGRLHHRVAESVGEREAVGALL